MKSSITIELFEEHDKVNFYTLRFQDEETEVDKFLDQFPEGCPYDEDPFLNSCVELLQEIDSYIRTRLRKGQLTIYNKQLFGNLIFHLKTKNDEE